MSSFGDEANVDKDLLSQIFADEGDEDSAETDALLDELLKDTDDTGKEDDIFADLTKEPETPAVEETLSEVVEAEKADQDVSVDIPVDIPVEASADIQVEAPVETPAAEPVVEETPAPVAEAVVEEPAAQAAEAPAEEKKEESQASQEMPKFEQNTDSDSVRVEATEKIEKERQVGNTTTITAGTTILGSISSDGALEVCGTITGDVDCRGMVSVVGQVTGDVIASEIYVSTERRLEGDLSSEGVIKIGVGTVVVGNVNATSAYIAGAVKGNIDVNGHVEVDSTAIIRGDINAKSIQVNSGAVVDGKMSLNYAGVDLDSFFNKQ